ncbi:MAG: spherulation-specific family 4 protein [Gammaproteobacteria bacterium]|nr:spherulation-specific family 4 protein [Gammaproteobacteria bacterium]
MAVIIGLLITSIVLIIIAAGSETDKKPYVEKYNKLRMLVPLYIYPAGTQGLEDYARVGRGMLDSGGRVDVIINPDNGSGSTSPPSSDFLTGMGILKSEAGDSFSVSNMYGYVHSNYGNRPIQEVKDEIDGYSTNWTDWLKGIFVDEVATDNDVYYTELFAYIESKSMLSVSNPGTNPLTVLPDIDSIVSFENSYSEWGTYEVSDAQKNSDEPLNWTVLILSNPNADNLSRLFDQAIARKFGRVFVSNLDEYHSALPVYFDAEMSLLVDG